MTEQAIKIDAARQALGSVGAGLPVSFTNTPCAALQRESVRRLERAGYHTAWTNEVIGKDAFAQLAVLLAATGRMTFGTSIANIWARAPQTAHGAAAFLTQAYPGRFALGLGVGYPEQAVATGRDFGSPLAAMRDDLERMNSETWPPAPDVAYPRIVAANGPKLLALAGELADGAMPATLPPEFTAPARQLLGPDKLLVVGLSVIVDSDRERAAAIARDSLSARLGVPSFATAIARLGYSDQEIAQVSDRLVNALVAHGGPAAIAAKAREHLAAGADHVTFMLPIGGEFAQGVHQLEQLGPALAEVS